MGDKKKLRHKVSFILGHNCIDFQCAWDKDTCKPKAFGSHGVNGTTITFVVNGEKGAVQFSIFTGWIPGRSYRDSATPMPADLGYHSIEPQWEGQSSMDCSLVEGGKCFYDGSSLNAENAWDTLVNAGETDLWHFLDEYYNDVFENGKYPATGEYRKPKRQP